jgi:hypothetical protein
MYGDFFKRTLIPFDADNGARSVVGAAWTWRQARRDLELICCWAERESPEIPG